MTTADEMTPIQWAQYYADSKKINKKVLNIKKINDKEYEIIFKDKTVNNIEVGRDDATANLIIPWLNAAWERQNKEIK
jgi:hypothetical protein